jgi:putative ABC transport system permease protein
MEMAEGRYFSRDFPTDESEAVIINQSLQTSLGWQNPIGKRLDISGETKNTHVIGVIRAAVKNPVDTLRYE